MNPNLPTVTPAEDAAARRTGPRAGVLPFQPPAVRKPRRAPPPALPTAFGEELERYLRWLAEPGNDKDRAYQASTIKQRRTELRLAASTLAKCLGDVTHVSSLRVLVQRDNAEHILDAFIRAAGGEPTAFVRTLATNLVALARHWVKPPAAELAQLIALRTDLKTTASGPTAKNEQLLRELADPARLDALLALPAALAAYARSARRSPARRRLAWRTAVAIELLLHTGMRLQELACLRIGEHLTWPDGPHGPLRVRAPGRQTRDGSPLEFELVGAPQALVQEYLERLAIKANRRQPHPWLFANANGTRVTDSALADSIAKATLRGIGLRITPHQLRHLCAMLILAAFPGDYATVKDLLGHQFLESTLALYGDQQRVAAFVEWHARLTQPHVLPRQGASHAQAA